MKHNWPIIQLSSIDSTNNYANALFSKEPKHAETVINTYSQVKGRGQQGNNWVSEDNKNLTFSLVLHSDYLLAEQQFYLSQTISLGIADYLNKHNIKAKVKWPNDIIAENRKIGGVLIEHSILGAFLQYSIIGIGLNMNQTTFSPYSPLAISLSNLTGKLYNLDFELNEILNCLTLKISFLKKLDFENIRKEYINNLFLFNEWATFKASGKKFKGKIIDVSPTGELVILSDSGQTFNFLFKEVEYALIW